MSSVWTIRRSASDTKVAGVCGGVARHWGVDPVLIRVGWALLALSGGVGVVLYLAGWLLIPQDGQDEPAVFDVIGASARRWPREVWVVLVAVCCLLAFTILGSLTPFGFGPAVILTLIWYFGYYKSRPTPPATFPEAAYAWQQRIEPVPRPTRRRAPRSARRLRLVALAGVALTWAGLGVAESLGRPVPVAGYLSAALLVLGLSLVAAAWRGLARGLLPVALLVCVATLVTTLSGPVARAQGWRSEARTYTTASQLLTGDQSGLGVLRVDLRSLALSNNSTTYTGHVGVGAIEVSVPQDANVIVNWKFKAGALLVNGTEVRAGSDLSGVQRLPSRDPRSKTLVLDLSVDQGLLQVRR